MALFDDNTAFEYRSSDNVAVSGTPSQWSVLEGKGGRQSYHALPPVAITLCKCVAVFCAVVFVVAIARVYLITMTFGYATQNAALSSSLESARAQAAELEVLQSVYSDPDRIWALATEAYGMTYPTTYADLDLSIPAVIADAEIE